jgi:hypothetical protein
MAASNGVRGAKVNNIDPRVRGASLPNAWAICSQG